MIRLVVLFLFSSALVGFSGVTAFSQVGNGANVPEFVRDPFPYPGPLHEVRGNIVQINGDTLTLRTRHGLISVNASYPISHYLTVSLFVPRPVLVEYALRGRIIYARDIQRAGLPSDYWPPDR